MNACIPFFFSDFSEDNLQHKRLLPVRVVVLSLADSAQETRKIQCARGKISDSAGNQLAIT